MEEKTTQNFVPWNKNRSKKEANSQNYLLNCPTYEKTTWNSFCGTKTKANSLNSLLNPLGEENTTQTSIPWNK
jgi:hypothetical protein